jgi:hypothetical protein
LSVVWPWRCLVAQKSNQDRRFLRERCEWPHHCRAANKYDEFASLHFGTPRYAVEFAAEHGS